MQISARSLVLKIIICIILIMLLIGALLKWGVPAAAEKVAAQLPENSIAELGNQSQNYVFTLTEKVIYPSNNNNKSATIISICLRDSILQR
ncbi:hypothetical protein ACG9Y7_18955 [Acinetobacter gerneri]|uniref:hypothetical protein n=1 Tax=Acinetobacter gerneri TaxID=202952 RepID=UPI003AF5A222